MRRDSKIAAVVAVVVEVYIDETPVVVVVVVAGRLARMHLGSSDTLE